MNDQLFQQIKDLTTFHKKKCKLYSDYLETFFPKNLTATKSLPYLPVRAFKEFELLSIDQEEIYKVMNSSGTTGKPSKIFLDKETARAQSSKLIEIFQSTFGNSRFPMIVIDSEETVKNRFKFSARTAAINGFSIFARKKLFALDENMELKIDELFEFINIHANDQIFIFGFTFMIWQNFLMTLKERQIKLPLSNAFILHGGGWKKLESLNISNVDFKNLAEEVTESKNIRNYYGMVEQTGTIFMECSAGKLHSPIGGDVIIRDSQSLEPLGHSKQGLIQLFSNIQKSYPGHSILTEDIGYTEDGKHCPCGNHQTIINIIGRLQNAEIRGCSDAYS